MHLCAIVFLTICFPRLSLEFPHDYVSGPWTIGSDFVYSGACVFPVNNGDRSWSINITFDKPINEFTFFNVIELMEDDEGYWVCVKNQFNQSPKLEFSVLFHARYEDNASVPVGECFVLKNNDTHCLQEDLTVSLTPNVTTEMSRLVLETTTYREERSMTTTSETGSSSLDATTMPMHSPNIHSTPTRNLSESVCKCDCLQSENTKSFTKLLQDLTINTKSLSSERRRKVSAEDNRASSKVMGGFGVLVIVSAFCFVLILDIKTFWLQIKSKLFH